MPGERGARILIGTSGYSFADWKGVYYPEDIPNGKMLDYYAQDFRTVEVNSTYYRIPAAAVFYHMSEKTPEGFEFIVKVHQDVTHKRENPVQSLADLKEALRPLFESGKMKGYLAQFPWGFKFHPSHLQYLKIIAEECRPYPLFVEFRHIGWVRPDVYRFLLENGIGYCCVDEPRLRGLIPPQDVVTNRIGYVRFHGRNAAAWWDSSKGDRYDYRYSKEELKEWLERIRKMHRQAEKIYLFFNNCHMGHAVINAQQMAELLQQEGLFEP
jgi:uncharacterized protein YecE (DUF72 family)